MIYTNNIEQTVKELELELNEELGTTSSKIFEVSATKNKDMFSDGKIEIECYWCLNLTDLKRLSHILGTKSLYVTRSLKGSILLIWTTYKIEGE